MTKVTYGFELKDGAVYTSESLQQIKLGAIGYFVSFGWEIDIYRYTSHIDTYGITITRKELIDIVR